MTDTRVAAPPATFNFAQHLFARNAARGSKVAYVDDHGQPTVAALDERAGAVAGWTFVGRLLNVR